MWKKSPKIADFREPTICEKSFFVKGRTFENSGRASTRIKTLLGELGLAEDVVRRAAIVAYEAEMNICTYAEHGTILLRVTPGHIIIEAEDEGQGIADIESAMKDGFSTATREIRHMGFGAGMGLGNIRNSSDDFSITSEKGKGTHLKIVICIDKGRERNRAQ